MFIADIANIRNLVLMQKQPIRECAFGPPSSSYSVRCLLLGRCKEFWPLCEISWALDRLQIINQFSPFFQGSIHSSKISSQNGNIQSLEENTLNSSFCSPLLLLVIKV